LTQIAAEPIAWRQLLARIGRNALARIDHKGIQMHRLTQAILRDYLSQSQADTTRAHGEAILASIDTGDPDDPGTWHQTYAR